MSLCLRLLSRAPAGRGCPLAGPTVRKPVASGCIRIHTAAASGPQMALQRFSADDWEKKNQKLGRPLSPHLTIYKFQLTSVLSITHRATGLALHFGLLGFAGAMVLLPGSYPYYLSLVAASAVGKAAIVSLKFALAWAGFYHTFNGVRHLVWDMGQGFSIRTLYKSGYAVVALTTLAALLVTAM